MATEKVKTRTISWNAVVARIDRQNERRKPVDDRPVVYEFGKRKFRDRRNPYETF